MSESVKRVALQRWARTKGLQAAREKEIKPSGRADKYYREAMEKAEAAGFASPQEIPEELPTPLPSVDEIQQSARQTEPSTSRNPRAEHGPGKTAAMPDVAQDYSRRLQIEELEVRVSPDGRRVNLEHQKTLQQASVLPDSRCITFEGEPVLGAKDEEVPIESWHITISFAEIDRGRLRFRLEDGMEFFLPVRPHEETAWKPHG